MGSSSKKPGKAKIVKKQASARQALKKNSKKGLKKAQNEHLLDILDLQALNTIADATKSSKPIQPDFSSLYLVAQTQNSVHALASSLQHAAM